MKTFKFTDDVNTSGIWQRARELASSNPEKLKNISYDAHMSVWPYYRGGIEIETANLTAGTLVFQNQEYKEMNIDLIQYELVDLSEAVFYLTKGSRPDCVFYCYETPKIDFKWSLHNEVCDLSV